MFTMDASLCGTTLLPKHAVNLFGHAAVKTQLSSRPEDLLGVRVVVNDGLPQHICERCKWRHWREQLRTWKDSAVRSVRAMRSCC